MTENDGPQYFNDDGTEFNPDLLPTPDLCVSCVKNEACDSEEDVLCNLTKADQQEDEVFLCFAYQPNSSNLDREAVLRGLCEHAGVEYPEEPTETDDDNRGTVRF